MSTPSPCPGAPRSLRPSACVLSGDESSAIRARAEETEREPGTVWRGGELVTVIIPAFNAERTLGATLGSVRAQTHRALEILVIDDGSIDATHAIARRAAKDDPRVRLIRQANAGVAAARNAGIAEARGAFIAPVDADDLWHPRKIELQLAAARRVGETLAFVYAWSRRIDESDVVLADLGPVDWCGDVFRNLIVSNFLRNASNALIPTHRLRAVGGFDPSLRAAGAQGAEDLKVFLALAENGFVEVVPAFLVGYRASPATMSRSALVMRRSIELTIAEAARRRPNLPARVLDVAALNYDLYAADIALRNKDLRVFGLFLRKALRRDPVLAVRLLVSAVRDRLSFRVRGMGRGQAFLDLDPEQSLLSARAPNRVDALLEGALGTSIS